MYRFRGFIDLFFCCASPNDFIAEFHAVVNKVYCILFCNKKITIVTTSPSIGYLSKVVKGGFGIAFFLVLWNKMCFVVSYDLNNAIIGLD